MKREREVLAMVSMVWEEEEVYKGEGGEKSSHGINGAGRPLQFPMRRRRFSFHARVNGDPFGFFAGMSNFDYISRLVTQDGTKEEASRHRPFVPILATD